MKHFTLFLTLISLVSAAVAIPPPVRPPRHAGAAFPPAPKMKRSRTPNVWWAFSRLSPAEQKELMELQRKDPEKFRSVMQKKSAELQEEQQKQP